VDDALGVRLLERGQDLPGESDRLLERDPPPADHCLEALALDVLHGEELDPLRLPEVEDADHVLVRDLPREEQLLLEAGQGLGALRRVEADGLERDELVELAVAGLVDATHAALAEDRHDLVPVREDAAEGQLAGLGRARRAARARRGGAEDRAGGVGGAEEGRRGAGPHGGDGGVAHRQRRAGHLGDGGLAGRIGERRAARLALDPPGRVGLPAAEADHAVQSSRLRHGPGFRATGRSVGAGSSPPRRRRCTPPTRPGPRARRACSGTASRREPP